MKVLSVVKTLLLVSFTLSSLHVSAENMKKMGSWDVHYIALGSTFVTPEVASAYNIKRSRFSGLVNISVLDNTKKGKPAKEVSISGIARNKIGQIKTLEFTEVKEGKAIYYLAQLTFADQEVYRFEVDITDGIEDHTLKFSQKFYVDQ